MKKTLNTLIVVSFLIPIAYFNWVLFDVGYKSEFYEINYFQAMYSLLNHWTSGEMGWFPIHSVIFGVVLIVIKKKFFSPNPFDTQWCEIIDE